MIERGGPAFCYKAYQGSRNDVTALKYPWCFAGKMNEVGHVEGVNEDTHSYFICILIMWCDSYTAEWGESNSTSKDIKILFYLLIFRLLLIDNILNKQ